MLVLPTLIGFFHGRIVINPACICPHWVIGLWIPIMWSGLIGLIPVIQLHTLHQRLRCILRILRLALADHYTLRVSCLEAQGRGLQRCSWLYI